MTVPSVTVKDSTVSDSASSVTAMSMSCVAPAADPAANVTVPDVSSSQPSVLSVTIRRSTPPSLPSTPPPTRSP